MPKDKKDATESLSPKQEAILTVLYRYMEGGIYNLHVLDEIQAADRYVGRNPTSLGTFYPTVKRLEEDGLIKGFWGEQDIAPGVKRRYLKITGAGTNALLTMRKHRGLLSAPSSKDLVPGLAPEQLAEYGG